MNLLQIYLVYQLTEILLNTLNLPHILLKECFTKVLIKGVHSHCKCNTHTQSLSQIKLIERSNRFFL